MRVTKLFNDEYNVQLSALERRQLVVIAGAGADWEVALITRLLIGAIESTYLEIDEPPKDNEQEQSRG